MALTLQRKLELAGALSKVLPQLQRFHVVEEPTTTGSLRRNLILVGGAFAAGAIVAVAVCRGKYSRYCWDCGADAHQWNKERSSTEQHASAAEETDGANATPQTDTA